MVLPRQGHSLPGAGVWSDCHVHWHWSCHCAGECHDTFASCLAHQEMCARGSHLLHHLQEAFANMDPSDQLWSTVINLWSTVINCDQLWSTCDQSVPSPAGSLCKHESKWSTLFFRADQRNSKKQRSTHHHNWITIKHQMGRNQRYFSQSKLSILLAIMSTATQVITPLAHGSLIPRQTGLGTRLEFV